MFDAGRVKQGMLVAGIVVALGASPSAFAAETIGQTFAPQNLCGENSTNLQTTSPPGQSYAAPSAGVITSWSFMAPAVVPSQIKFKVGHQVSADSFEVAGESPESPLKTPVASTLNTYDIRVAVEQGDVIGLYLPDQMMCGTNPAAGYDYDFFAGDAPLGLSALWTFGGGVQFDVSAQLEADADGDGFGDESQDLCPTDPSTQGPCPDGTPPDTIIDSPAQGTTSDATPTFSFHSTEGNSTFDCSIDTGAPSFGACSGPGASHTPASALADGTYTFRVRATDDSGNTDPSEATQAFTVQSDDTTPPDPPAVPDTAPPETTITKDAPKKTAKHKVKFAFESDENGSRFECQLDGKSLGDCTSPLKLKHLRKGKHKFKVWAIDEAGNVDLSAARDRFKIVD